MRASPSVNTQNRPTGKSGTSTLRGGLIGSLGMSNVLSQDKKQQIIALGKLRWPLRRIEQAIGGRRETASVYLEAAWITVQQPGGWGARAWSKPADGVITDLGEGKTASRPNLQPTNFKPTPTLASCWIRNCVRLKRARRRRWAPLRPRFSREIASEDGLTYQLPWAEYDYKGDVSRNDVFESAKASAPRSHLINASE